MKNYTYKDLKSEDIEYLTSVYTSSEISHTEKMDILTKKFGVVGRTIRRWAKEKLGLSNNGYYKDIPGSLLDFVERSLPDNVDIVMLTAAQNKTPVNKRVLDSMLAYKSFLEKRGNKVEIVVAPTRYRNPTSLKEKSDEWWDNQVKQYLYYNKVNFLDSCFIADLRVNPTATNPLSGLDFYTSGQHAIIPHPRIHFESMPRFMGMKQYSKCTTGYITHKNYSRSKSGNKGDFHHSYGFTIVEKKNENETYFPRNVKIQSDGSFCDVIYEVKDNKVNVLKTVPGLVLGDIHEEQISGGKMVSTIDYTKKVKVEKTILHDLYDGCSVNPHETKDLYIQRRKVIEGRHLVKPEIESAIEFAKNYAKESSSDVYVVQSNHDDFLDRWVNSFKPKDDFHNSHTYAELLHIQQTEDLSEFGNIFGYLCSKEGVKYIKNYESFIINGYQAGHHGEHGVNGSRGSVTQFKNQNEKMIIGHGHCATMIDNVTMVGMSCNIWQYYNRKGKNKGNYADSVIFPNGKNQLFVYDEDNYKFTNLI